MTTNKQFENFTIHGLDPRGINILTGGTGYGARGVVLYPGSTFEVTEAVYAAQTDRLGNNFLDLTTEEQVARWGAARWGRGAEIPASVAEGIKARRIAQLETERDDITWSGGLRGDGTKLARLTAVRAELEELGVTE